jgi:NAD-dependent dihydropyrimidine dehydrogenase PreA subunit
MEREIVKINEELCDGCGECVPGCHEGALQIIDGKARLISDLMCDGLGACIGHCPQGAISIEKREAEPYDEVKVMELMIEKGRNTVIAHMKHLKDHNETGFLKQAVKYLKENSNSIGFEVSEVIREVHNHGSACNSGSGGGCPGSQSQSFASGHIVEGFAAPAATATATEPAQSSLSHWPVQMHLINPAASHYQGADVVLAADCVAYSLANFHQKYLKDKALAIACPKLDQGPDIYVEKIRRLIDEAHINTLHLMIMQVPCCGGLLQMIRLAQSHAKRKIPVKQSVVGIQGEVLSEEWI